MIEKVHLSSRERWVLKLARRTANDAEVVVHLSNRGVVLKHRPPEEPGECDSLLRSEEVGIETLEAHGLDISVTCSPFEFEGGYWNSKPGQPFEGFVFTSPIER